MSKLESKGLVPELRFSQFIGGTEWQKKPFNKLYTLKVTNSLSRDKLNYDDGLVKNIHYGDIHTKFSTLFDITKEYVPFINTEISLDKVKEESYCQEGDMVFADASEDIDDVGKSIELINLNGEKLLSGLHTILARQKGSYLVKGFGGYLFKSEVIRKQIQKESQGAKVLGISGSRISNIDVIYPIDHDEQQKIADCLSSMDDLITTNTKKLDSLKLHKKGLLQTLFPEEGKSVPELRFDGFNGCWKKKPFSKLFEIGSGKDHKHLADGDIPVYGSGGYMRSVNDYLYEGKSACIGRKGTINKPVLLAGKFWTVDTLFYTHSFKNCIPEFVYLLFQNIDWLKLNEAGGVPSLSKVIINKIEVFIPEEDEQQRIVDCVSSLDELIKIESDKIEALKEYKKGLMQQLFPEIKESIA
ncbi:MULTISPECIES: restriction endonuclease subunit S [Vibrio]|uniref:restriction endonuclease subunit S n=1 Tax=Vibrio TaxID=662 RepID=UPI001C9C394F|nr:restriction endonuclease subunit S [Vibrio anguillarum]MBY7668012.1 restriction endonuclease subunit S [Vibrio anguillarum]